MALEGVAPNAFLKDLLKWAESANPHCSATTRSGDDVSRSNM